MDEELKEMPEKIYAHRHCEDDSVFVGFESPDDPLAINKSTEYIRADLVKSELQIHNEKWKKQNARQDEKLKPCEHLNLHRTWAGERYQCQSCLEIIPSSPAPSLALREVREKVEKRIDEVRAGDGYGNTRSVRLFELDLFLSMLKELEGKI